MRYYGNKEKFVQEILDAMPKNFNRYLELCAGTATVARRLVSRGVKREVVEMDRGQVALLVVIRDRPQELIRAMYNLKYSSTVYELAKQIRDGGYNCDDLLIAAVAKKVIIDFSYNSACGSYRNPQFGKSDFDKMLNEKQYVTSYFRNVPSDIMSTSAGLQGVEILQGDMMDYLNKLSDPNLFCFCDPPYRPAVRSAKHLGYDIDMSEEKHEKFLEALVMLRDQNKLNAKMMICGYVDWSNLKDDLYVRKLLPLGFKLVIIKETYLPAIIRNGMNKTRNKAIECVFVNYDDSRAKNYGSDAVYTYKSVYGKE